MTCLYFELALIYSPIEPLETTSFSVGTNRTIRTNGIALCPARSHGINNRSLLNEKHIHQQNYWNDILFYWYQWTVGIALYPARSHAKIIEVPLLRCIFTNRTTGMTSLSIGTNHTISTNEPSV